MQPSPPPGAADRKPAVRVSTDAAAPGSVKSPVFSELPVSPNEVALSRTPSGRVRVKSVSEISRKQEAERGKKVPKKVIELVRRVRNAFADAYAAQHNIADTLPFFKCAPLGCLAVAVSQVLTTSAMAAGAGGNDEGPLPAVTPATLVSVGNIFCDLKLPFHYLSMSGLTMAEVHDFAVQYLSAGAKTKDKHFKVAYMTCDAAQSADDVPEEEEEIALLDTQVVSLVDFRREMVASTGNANVAYIFNYDPYVVQEHFVALAEEDDDDDDDEGCGGRRMSVQDRMTLLQKYKRKNQGAFAVFHSYNQAESKVAIEGFDPATQALVREVVPLSVLYDACSVRDGYTKRPRGVISIEVVDGAAKRCPRATYAGAADEWAEGLLPKVSMLEEGGGPGFLLEQADPSLKPHLVAAGYAVQLFNLRNARTSGVTIPRWQGRVGVALPDIAYELDLPLEGFVGASGANAVTDAYVALASYLRSRGCDAVRADVVYYQRKGHNVDGFPNHLAEDLEAEILSVVNDRRDTIMVLSFDVNATHHVGRSGEKMPHFGVLAGYDAAAQQVVVADVAPKIYKRRWKISLSQLWGAMIGGGYILISPEKKGFIHPLSAEIEKNCAAVAACGKYRPPLTPDFMTYEYPSKVYCASVVALAMTMMTGRVVQVQHVIKNSGFMPSFLLSDHLSLGDFERVAHLFITACGDGARLTSSCHYFDEACATADAFHALLADAHQHYCDKTSILVLNLSAAALAEREKHWNGGDTGSYVILQSYDAATRTAVLTSVARDPSKRCFELPLVTLFMLCQTVDPVSRRVRGYMRLSKAPEAHPEKRLLYDRPVGGCVSVSHPFKLRISAHVSGLAWAFKALGHETMPETIYYTWNQGSGLELLGRFQMHHFAQAVETYASRLGLPFTCERCMFASCEGLRQKIATAAPQDHAAVLVAVPSGLVLGTDDTTPTCGVIVAYDDDAVTVQDSNPTRYGRQWTAPWSRLYEFMAADTSLYGVVSICRT
eukprot:TRINITY_DN15662_c0_g1_i1.p1 TRINITY_DN15662_c0_g1~~TRINITY_DN15662_c0_g1_i1.p1  ORF type:complete len:1141 (+),score=369.61 TRINITY_DN15662_c0_g1_i1:429-3425(+)